MWFYSHLPKKAGNHGYSCYGIIIGTLHKYGTLILDQLLIWAGPNELRGLGGVHLLGDWPNYHDVPSRTYEIRRPVLVTVFLSAHSSVLLTSNLG